jgi:hypothetical protein
MPIWSAVAVAPPPGTIRPKALPESCEVATGNQACARSASRWSIETAAKLSASAGSMSTAHHGARFPSERQDENTSTRLGSRR